MAEHLFLDRSQGRLALYLGGDLQFDSDDERLYHEPLAALPAALAARRAGGRPLQALILGGGDGLALRELLRRPELGGAQLVDRDEAVLALGRGELSGLNERALFDPRVRVLRADARERLAGARGLDLLVWDLTFPSSQDGCELLTRKRFAQARAALREDGVLAVNGVSPELTPQAFCCLGATIEAAGFSVLPISAEIPSFRREGYGRWGFFLASPTPWSAAELASPALAEACLLPRALGALEVSANESDELLYYLANAEPIDWTGPFERLRPRARAGGGPRLTAAEGFARWARGCGQRSLEELLACLPLSRRDQTRQAILEWSHQAELLFRETDLAAFCRAALRRAGELPRSWVRELEALLERVDSGRPRLSELLEQAYRVFAVFLLILLTVNLFFPDNLYAKGFSSHYGGSGGSSWSGPSFSFSRPYSRPYRYRYRQSGFGHGRPGRVYDRGGRSEPGLRLQFSDPKGGLRPAEGLFALSPELQLLDSGQLGYKLGLEGFQAALEPDRLSVTTSSGAPVLELLPDGSTLAETSRQLRAQRPLLDKALADHRRWLEWTGWAAGSGQGAEDRRDLAQLERMASALSAAQARWPAPESFASLANIPSQFHALQLLPGAWLEPPNPEHPASPMILWRDASGALRRRSVLPPLDLGDEDRLVFQLLRRRFHGRQDESLRDILSAWASAHGPALGPQAPLGPPAP